jgi:diguanylate cyclase (GGDEF)-like protein/PAS domain S-box-containing protein
MPDRPTPAGLVDANQLQAEIARLHKIINALMERAERSTEAHGSDFSLFQTTILLEEQVRCRTAELEAALHENERIERALRKSEATFRGVVSQSLVGIGIIEQGKLTYANSKLAEIFGYCPEEILQLSVDLAAPADRALVGEQVRRRMSREVDRVEYQFKGMRKNRAEIDVECHSSVMEVAGQPALITLIIDITERVRAARKLQELQDSLREQAIHDPLTGLYNRLHLCEFLDRELALAERNGYPVALILADLDRFKAINDTYGHVVGDKVLQKFAALIKKHCRASDICCRYGGEEFLLVLPNITYEKGIERAENVRAAIASREFTSGTSAIRVTSSFGVAIYPQHGLTRNALISAADQALYKAKNAGRNQVNGFSEIATPETRSVAPISE